jgi:ABC-type Mn2+/Zn2+ transport system permease subunit/Mn-dependent DtxR family transcriptional regulator
MIPLAELWFDWSIDLWPLVLASLVGVSCGLLGAVFLVRRNALLGDAVSHSVLPGVAGGLLLLGAITRPSEESVFGASIAMVFVLAGALGAGLLATLLIEALHRHSRLKPDTALGSVFPAFFAAGVILIEIAAEGAHFDLDCVFYGSLEVIGRFEQTVPTLVTAALVAVLCTAGYKEILAASFDPGFARSLGLRQGAVGLVLVCLLAAAVVSAFEAVGAILVVAFLTIPPATAYVLADRFHHVLFLSAGLGLSAAVLGCWGTNALGSLGFETSRAPTMAVVAGLEFVTVLVAAPGRGWISRWRRQRRLGKRIDDENLLGAVYRLSLSRRSPLEGHALHVEEAAKTLGKPLARLRAALRRGLRRGEVAWATAGGVVLTESGRQRIEQTVRAHRLWESYMMHELGAAPDHVHAAADEIEHYLQPELVEELAALLHHPERDPHGREIPPEPRRS